MDRQTDVPGRTLRGCLPVLALQVLVSLSWGPGVESVCVIRLYYNLSAEVPSYVDQTCDIACCGHYPNIYCCDQCDSTFRDAAGHLGSGAVTGIVLGVLIGLVIIFVIFVYVYGRWRRDKDPVGRAMYRLYRMSTRRRRRPKPPTAQDGQTTDGPSTIPLPNGGTENRAFRDDQGNYPRSRRRAPKTSETPMHEEQLSKPPKPGHSGPRGPDRNHTPPRDEPIKGNPPPKYGQFGSPQTDQGSVATPSAPVLELDTRRLDNSPNTNYQHLSPTGGGQGYDPKKRYLPSDKQYQALGKRHDEHPYTAPQNTNQSDKYGRPRDSGHKDRLPSDSRLGPQGHSRQYVSESRTSHPPDGHIQSSRDKYQSDRQIPLPSNKYSSQPSSHSSRNNTYQQDLQKSSNRDASYPPQPPDRSTSYPADRQAAYQNVTNDNPYKREPRPSYPPDGRGDPGYPPYSSTPGRGAPTQRPEYKDTPIRHGDYKKPKDNLGVNLGTPGGSRQSQI